MTGHVVKKLRVGSLFRPTRPEEFVALQLARRLGGLSALPTCYDLVCTKPLMTLVAALRETHAVAADERLTALVESANAFTNTAANDTLPSVLAVKVERRTLAIVLAKAGVPERAQVRELSSKPDAATTAARRFVQQAVLKFPDCAVALEVQASDAITRRSALIHAVWEEVSSLQCPIMRVEDKLLLEAFAHPAYRTRQQMRHAVARYWAPIAKRQRPVLIDALALAFYAFVEMTLSSKPRICEAAA